MGGVLIQDRAATKNYRMARHAHSITDSLEKPGNFILPKKPI